MPAKFWAVRRALRSYEHLKLEESSAASERGGRALTATAKS
jgi:hypothetical protein